MSIDKLTRMREKIDREREKGPDRPVIGTLEAEYAKRRAATADELAVLMGTRAESVAVFHIFVDGECWISMKGTEPFRLSAGSAIIFSHSPSHELASTPGLAPDPIISLLTYPENAAIPAIRHGGGGSLTRFLCGYLQCNHRFNPLIGALPALIIATPDGTVIERMSSRRARAACSGSAPERSS